MWSFLRAAVLVASIAWLGPQQAFSQQVEPHNRIVDRINGGSVGIISGGIGGTYIRIATDLASVLDDGDELRVLPMMGKGSVQNITDVLYLRGVDIGIVQSDVLAHLQRQKRYPNIEARVQYITKLYNEEFHVVAASSIGSMKDLAGKKVNFDLQGSGTEMTASTVFETLGIEVERVHFDQALALQKIKGGEIAATVYVAGKPAKAIADLKTEDGLKLLPVPFTGALQKTYLPASLASADYPRLLSEGKSVETIAVGAVMAVFNWRQGTDRHKRLQRFTQAFFSKFEEFQKPPRHPKWQEVNLAAELPGWTRFDVAASWLAVNKVVNEAELKTEFERFVAKNPDRAGNAMSPAQQEALFRDFVRWRETNR